jgi:hypothetical protein
VKKPIAYTSLVLLALLLAPLISTALTGSVRGGQPRADDPYPVSPAGLVYLPLVLGTLSSFPGIELPTLTPTPSPTPSPTPVATSTTVPYP